MKKLYPLLSVLFLVYWGCEEPTEPDTTPPSVTITSPQSGSTVSEVVSVTCISTDNEGVEKVELWIDGVSTGITDNTEPYSMDWNTTTYDNKSYTITVRSYDVNDNMTDSDPITLIVDNSGSNPQSISITSIVFDDGSFTITWNQSIDGDFASYDLEKSVESTMGDYDVVYSTEAVTDTTYVDSDVDPLSYQYYRITVIDTFGYETKGQIVSSSLDPVPTSVNVTSVTYTLDEMTVEWEESPDSDFNDYKLLYSESESGDRDTVVTYTDKSTTSHIITDFDPTHENWFWVLVSDTLGQSSIGSGMTNVTDLNPNPVDVISVTYDLSEMTVTWEMYEPNLDRINLFRFQKQRSNYRKDLSNKWSGNREETKLVLDNDFVSYELLQSDSENGTYSSVVVITDQTTTSHMITEFDPTQENWFKVKVTDFWNLTSTGNGMTNEIESPPTPSELYPIVYENGSFIITWSQNSDYDFQSYTLYESTSEDMSGETLIYETDEITDTTYVVTGIGESERGYYRIVVTDIFNLETSSSIVSGSSYLKIVYESYRDGQPEIYIMDVDGSNQTNLTNNSIHDYYPQFSPDGLTIIFNSQVEGTNGVIYTMNLDGTNKVRLTNNGWEYSPRFSPDGSKIVFVLPESGNNWSSEIYIMNSDGSNQTRLTDNDGDDNSPQFSPDGSKIVLKTTIIDNDSTYREIYLIDVDGSNQTRLTYHSTVVHDYEPKFSPDGSKIVFVSHLSGNNHEIYIMNIDGSNQTNLTNNIDKDNSPQFSPDGSKIMFVSDRDGNYQIYIMDVDGSNQTNLTNTSGYIDDTSPQFSPDGSKIVFLSDRDGNWEIYIMDVDGSNQTNLTNDSGNDYSPQFQPQP